MDFPAHVESEHLFGSVNVVRPIPRLPTPSRADVMLARNNAAGTVPLIVIRTSLLALGQTIAVTRCQF